MLLAFVGVPLAMPFVALGQTSSAWTALEETGRLSLLARNTLLLVAGTLAVATPPGVAGAVLLYRTDLPWRRLLRFLVVVTLFIPLPLFASGWQAALGSGGWLPLHLWTTAAPSDPDVSSTGIAWKPWAHGLPAAIWIHAVAGLPWIILLLGQGLRWVERELEEDALTAARPWWVLTRVTLPRSRAALGAALIWVALQTATEITVTDMLQVRTFAEEVYNQFVRPGINDSAPTIMTAVARAVAVSLPGTMLIGLLVWWGARRWEQHLPPLDRLALRPWTFTLGWSRWPCLFLVLGTASILVGIPVGSLAWKAGRTTPPPTPPPEAYVAWMCTPATGTPAEVTSACWWAVQPGEAKTPPPYWSAHTAKRHIATVLHVRGGLVWDSLWQAAAAGAFVAALAWVICWLAAGSRRFRALILVLIVAAWSMPGPVIGIGLKETIECILSLADGALRVSGRFLPSDSMPGAVVHEVLLAASGVVETLLFYGPSPLPVMWADVVRFFPVAVAVLWPVVRLVPRELLQSAQVDGASPAYELRRVVAPLTVMAFIQAGLVVAILSLGELSAGKLAETPGSTTFAHEVFVQMHYGVTNDLAALCLVLLGVVLCGAALVGLAGWLIRAAPKTHL
jgi:iron(III) transport system permease protein